MSKISNLAPSSKISAATAAGAAVAIVLQLLDQLAGVDLTDVVDQALIVVGAFAAGWAKPDNRIAVSALEAALAAAKDDAANAAGELRTNAEAAVRWLTSKISRVRTGLPS